MAEGGGRPPMVRLTRLAGAVAPAVLVKLEYYGPSGSLKDRIYRHMFEQAERRAELRPGMAVLECSTGNAGTACAFMAAVKGYPCTLFIPGGVGWGPQKLIRAYR